MQPLGPCRRRDQPSFAVACDEGADRLPCTVSSMLATSKRNASEAFGLNCLKMGCFTNAAGKIRRSEWRTGARKRCSKGSAIMEYPGDESRLEPALR